MTSMSSSSSPSGPPPPLTPAAASTSSRSWTSDEPPSLRTACLPSSPPPPATSAKARSSATCLCASRFPTAVLNASHTLLRNGERSSHRRLVASPASDASGASASRVVAAGDVFRNASRSIRSARHAGFCPSFPSYSSTAARFASPHPANTFAARPMSSCDSGGSAAACRHSWCTISSAPRAMASTRADAAAAPSASGVSDAPVLSTRICQPSPPEASTTAACAAAAVGGQNNRCFKRLAHSIRTRSAGIASGFGAAGVDFEESTLDRASVVSYATTLCARAIVLSSTLARSSDAAARFEDALYASTLRNAAATAPCGAAAAGAPGAAHSPTPTACACHRRASDAVSLAPTPPSAAVTPPPATTPSELITTAAAAAGERNNVARSSHAAAA
eukprot:30925-Pelagococcus_subviridis.AAC.1